MRSSLPDRINRAVVALIGAVIVIAIGALDQNQAIAGINWNTIGLLTGMMILVSIARRSGVFQFLAIWSAQRANASPAGILIVLQLTTAVLSALLNNVSTVLLVAPVTLVIVEELDLPAFPFLFAEIFASNIGGTATLIGDPPNILIGSSAGLNFNAFLVNLTPVIILVMAVQLFMVHAIWGRKLRATPAEPRPGDGHECARDDHGSRAPLAVCCDHRWRARCVRIRRVVAA